MMQGMSRSVRLFAMSAALAGFTIFAAPAQAVPGLQLDIVGGTYDATTQTIVTSDTQFTVLALATPTGNLSLNEILNEDFFLSIAIVPHVDQDPSFDTGSFDVNGATIGANDSSLYYGTPPVSATANPDLPDHGVFPTYFAELLFHFNADDTTTTYNVQDHPGGGFFDTNGTGSYFATFDIDMSGILGYGLHFDTYDIRVKHGEIIIDHFAPFSHDAEAGGGDNEVPDVPEPASALLLLAGLVGAGLARRRVRANG